MKILKKDICVILLCLFILFFWYLFFIFGFKGEMEVDLFSGFFGSIISCVVSVVIAYYLVSKQRESDRGKKLQETQKEIRMKKEEDVFLDLLAKKQLEIYLSEINCGMIIICKLLIEKNFEKPFSFQRLLPFSSWTNETYKERYWERLMYLCRNDVFIDYPSKDDIFIDYSDGRIEENIEKIFLIRNVEMGQDYSVSQLKKHLINHYYHVVGNVNDYIKKYRDTNCNIWMKGEVLKDIILYFNSVRNLIRIVREAINLLEEDYKKLKKELDNFDK